MNSYPTSQGEAKQNNKKHTNPTKSLDKNNIDKHCKNPTHPTDTLNKNNINNHQTLQQTTEPKANKQPNDKQWKI